MGGMHLFPSTRNYQPAFSQASLPFCRARAGSRGARGRQRASGALPTGLVALPHATWFRRNGVEMLLAILCGPGERVGEPSKVWRAGSTACSGQACEVIKTIPRTTRRPQDGLTGACCGVAWREAAVSTVRRRLRSGSVMQAYAFGCTSSLYRVPQQAAITDMRRAGLDAVQGGW